MQLGKKYNVKLLSRLFGVFLILGEISIYQIPKCFKSLFPALNHLNLFKLAEASFSKKEQIFPFFVLPQVS